MNTRKEILKIAASLLLIILTSVYVFAQEENLSCSSPDPLAIAIKTGKKIFRGNLYFSELIAFLAVRENDISLCNQTPSPLNCRHFAELCLEVKKAKECKGIKDRDSKNICEAVKNKDCSSLSGEQRDICNGFLKEDFNLIRKSVFNKLKFTKMADREPAVSSAFMGFSLNYRYGEEKCEEFASTHFPIPFKFFCKIIFGKGDARNILEEITQDLGLFMMAKSGWTDACETIGDRDIRERCLNPAIKDIKDIWWK